MKFIYTGQTPIKDVDLVLAGIFKPTERITKGRVFEVPDSNPLLCQRVKVQGIYEVYVEPKRKVGRPKKEKNKKEKELEEEN